MLGHLRCPKNPDDGHPQVEPLGLYRRARRGPGHQAGDRGSDQGCRGLHHCERRHGHVAAERRADGGRLPGGAAEGQPWRQRNLAVDRKGTAPPGVRAEVWLAGRLRATCRSPCRPKKSSSWWIALEQSQDCADPHSACKRISRILMSMGPPSAYRVGMTGRASTSRRNPLRQPLESHLAGVAAEGSYPTATSGSPPRTPPSG